MMLFDAIVFIAFLALYTASFLAGGVRTVVALVTWFVVMVAAALFTGPLAAGFRSLVPPMSRWASELIAFVVVVLIGVLGVWGTVWSLRAAPSVIGRWQRGPVGPVHLLLQAFLAMVFAVVMVTTLVMVATNTIRQLPGDAIGNRLRTEVRQSRLVPLVADLEPWLKRAVIEWVPGDPPVLLRGT
ncbi:MAG: CvpA family protein [Thermomicrobium sp.]|nr:CvpA family protein [Thermomicrobium sp.]